MAEKAPSIASSTPSASWKGWLWDSADVSKEERRFLLKVGYLTMVVGFCLTKSIVGLHSVDLRHAWNVDQMGE
jgi:hypothetical protein